VANLPRLPPTLEHHLIRALCGLPPRAQRLLFGRPPVLDGQRLESDINVLLKLAQIARSDSFTAESDPAVARRHRRLEARIVARRPPWPMRQVEAVTIPGPGGPIPSRLYVPTTPQGPGKPPLLVYFHGGGWVIGDLDTHDDPCRFLATHSGAAVLAVDYRLAPEHPFPAAVDDALSAYAWALDSAEALGLDPARVAVGGDSAGGNLAAVVSFLAREAGLPLPVIQLLIYPVTDTDDDTASRRLFAEGFLLTRADMEFFEAHYLSRGSDREDPRVAILRAEDLSGLPATYIATAGFDPLRDEAEAFAGRLREAGVAVALRRHPGLVHTFANLTSICPSARAAMLEAAGALRMGLGSPA
jgi:acetyl esterase/lipase